MNILPTETPEIIITEDLKALGVHSEESLAKFARVANGLINNGVYPKAKVLLMFAQMIDSPKKFSFSKNKLTNLSLYTKHLKEIGQEIIFISSCLHITCFNALGFLSSSESLVLNFQSNSELVT